MREGERERERTEDANIIAKLSAVWDFFAFKRSGYMWQLNAFQEWYEAFSVVFPRVKSGKSSNRVTWLMVAVSNKCPCSTHVGI